MISHGDMQPPESYAAIARTLGNDVDTIIDRHLLRRNLVGVFLRGQLPKFEATILQPMGLPTEVTGYGTDPSAIVTLLTDLSGWECINVDLTLANPVAALLEERLGTAVDVLDDIYHLQDHQIDLTTTGDAHILGLTDLPLLENTDCPLPGPGYHHLRDLLDKSIVAGVKTGGKIVSYAQVTAFDDIYADLGVFTLDGYRGHGYALATSQLVIDVARSRGYKPVWSCGANNEASLRIARRLGFREVKRRRYLIPHPIDHQDIQTK